MKPATKIVMMSGKIQRYDRIASQLEIEGAWGHETKIRTVVCRCDLEQYQTIRPQEKIGVVLAKQSPEKYAVQEIWNDAAPSKDYRDLYQIFEQIAKRIFGPSNP